MMSPLLILATGWMLVGAADLKKSNKFNRYDKDVVADDTVFQRPAASAIFCAILCQQQDACKGFTFEGKVCSGHRLAWRSSTTGPSANGARLFVKESPGPHYAVLDDVRRDVNNGPGKLSDHELIAGWYRFLLNGTDAVMPTQCVPFGRCGTVASYWLDLQGGELPAVGHETAARACAQWTEECCVEPVPVTVRNTGDFYLYKLGPSLGSSVYCAKRRNN
ncbi:pancreatic secretory granule membrane major glycoprotein GP2-like [Littorina saxatilis]|uniref:UMOD/GP2/OIT3-like D8C domain-containing protein n=1 Tax=Littorina saxatilis TaxID=31220 RepID=A0AAN9ASG5_9CAEN